MRVGVVGLGTVGVTHVRAFTSAGGSVVGADPVAERRQAAEESFGIECFADVREMVFSRTLDAVVVAVPPALHPEVAIFASRQGLDVLCEKPLALTVEDCDRMSDAAQDGDRLLAVGFCHRYQPEVAALRLLVSRGDLGAVRLVRIQFVHGIDHERRGWLAVRDISGGGVLADSGCHAIDLFHHLVGPIEDAAAWLSPRASGGSGGQVEDAAVVSVRAGDVLGSIELCWKAPPWEGHVEVVGERGRAAVDYAGDLVVLRRLDARSGDWYTVDVVPADRFLEQARAFLSGIARRRLPPDMAGAIDGRRTTEVLRRAYASQGPR